MYRCGDAWACQELCSCKPVGQLCSPAAAGQARSEPQRVRSSLLQQLPPADASSRDCSSTVCTLLGGPAYWCACYLHVILLTFFVCYHSWSCPICVQVHAGVAPLQSCTCCGFHMHGNACTCMACVRGIRAPGCVWRCAIRGPCLHTDLVCVLCAHPDQVCRVCLRTPDLCAGALSRLDLPCNRLGRAQACECVQASAWAAAAAVAAAHHAPACSCWLDSLGTCVVGGS